MQPASLTEKERVDSLLSFLGRAGFVGELAQPTFIVFLDAKECASCSGAGLGIRMLQSRARLSAHLVHSEESMQEVAEFFERELLNLRRWSVSESMLKAALGSKSGGGVIRLCERERTVVRTSPKFDWPKVVDSDFSLPDCPPASG